MTLASRARALGDRVIVLHAIHLDDSSPRRRQPPLTPRRAACLMLRVEGKGSTSMIRKLKSGEYRLYSRKKNPKTGKRRNLGTFKTLEAARQHERAVQYFKRH
jgi:hypothetical protein